MEKIEQSAFRALRKEQGIYGIFSPTNGKWYVGSACFNKDEKRTLCALGIRLYKHLYDLRRNKHANKHLQRACNKHGIEYFQFFIIERLNDSSREFLVEREQYWMDALKSHTQGYNICPTAESRQGFRHSDQTKELLRQRSSGRKYSEESKKKMSQWQIGKVLSEETKHKISESEKGKIISPELRKRWSDTKKGKKKSEETKKRMSLASHTRRLTTNNVIDIRNNQYKKTGEELARFYKVTEATIHNVWNRRTWRYV